MARPELHVITELDQIKALSDPLRQRILGAFAAEPRTTKQVATLLGQPPTKLYRYVDQLEKVGLIKLVDTRPKRGTTEKYFQAVAHRFAIGRSLSGETSSVIAQSFTQAFAAAQDEILKAMDCGEKEAEAKLVLALGSLRISPEKLPELRDRIAALAEGLEGGDAEKESFRFLVAIYPSSASPTDA